MNARGVSGRTESAPTQPLPQRVTRSTRRNDVQRASTPRATRISQPIRESQKERGVLLGDPPPRRGAPPRERSYSIPTERPDDETEYSEEDESVQHDEVNDHSEEAEGHEDEAQVHLVITPAQQRILELSVPDLARAADSLFKCFQQKQAYEDVFDGVLGIRRRAFYNIRAEYQLLDENDDATFIDFAHFLNENFTPDRNTMVTQIARINVVTAFDRIWGIEDQEASYIFPFLESLNRALPAFFTPADNMFQSPQSTLHLRTWLFVEALGQNKDNKEETDFRDVLVRFFCKDPEEWEYSNELEHGGKRGRPSHFQLFAGGYFKDLGGINLDDHDADDLCSSRIAQIKKIIDDNPEDGGITQLRKEFPLHNLVQDLQDCFTGLYKVLAYAYEESVRAGTELPQHDQQETTNSQSNDFMSESQSIVRVGSQEAEPSLFVNEKSLQALRGDSRAPSTVPPSYQQLAELRPAAPRDYRQDKNSDLLRGSPFPPASSYRLVVNGESDRGQGQKRPRPATEEDDGDDPFETDTRRVNPMKRDELKRQMPPPPRPEPVVRSLPRNVPESSFPSSVQESSQDMGLRAASLAPSSSVPFNAIAQAASQRKKEVRMAEAERQGPRQRVFWSEHDSQVLLNLIQEYGVRWSTIETMGERFEYPRNQQAYRDRARNLKTEMLIADIPLPPNFDDVALGSKEVAKIKGVGKNPYRKEADVDGNGKPINTEFAESTPF
ncbi:hypothetical protein F53441_735 [Fusarium austroafricanum]|uniref:Myb-like domain-containing protein n=1 Tax=Fusarium austroafricanum TaxID=2364996 RepID=A0A8H4KWZ9_9HYPO|nr:hypothetical protein F53441_735 [Fusarium austroafricanum]